MEPNKPNEWEGNYPPAKKKDYKVLKAVVITILVISLMIGGMLFVITQFQASYNQGANDGAQFLYSEIVNEVGRCQPYPIQIQNQTVNLILVECLTSNAEDANNG